MVPVLACIAIVLFLAVIWLGVILIDRSISDHFNVARAHCEQSDGDDDDVPTHMECQH